MSEDTFRSVEIERTGLGNYVVRNVRGGSVSLGAGEDASFTPVELLLAAIGGCTAVDVDHITSRRAEPTRFAVDVTGDKVRDEAGGNRMRNLRVEFTVTFPEGADGDRRARRCPVRCGSHTIGCAPSPGPSNSARPSRSSTLPSPPGPDPRLRPGWKPVRRRHPHGRRKAVTVAG
ncbi:OsmC family protein [Micromonospora sp. M12]